MQIPNASGDILITRGVTVCPERAILQPFRLPRPRCDHYATAEQCNHIAIKCNSSHLIEAASAVDDSVQQAVATRTPHFDGLVLAAAGQSLAVHTSLDRHFSPTALLPHCCSQKFLRTHRRGEFATLRSRLLWPQIFFFQFIFRCFPFLGRSL